MKAPVTAKERHTELVLRRVKYSVGQLLDLLTEVPEGHYSSVEVGAIDTDSKTITMTFTYAKMRDDE